MKPLLAVLLMLSAAAAQAQAVWRCGADGRSYSDRPCAEGRALEMAELADTRTPAELQAAREVAARDRRLADTLRHERIERERIDHERQALPPARREAAALDRPTGREKLRAKPKAKATEEPRVARVPAPAARGISRAAAPSSRRTKG